MESGVFEKMPCLVVDMETGDSGTLGLYAVFWLLVSTLKVFFPSRAYVLSGLKGNPEISPRLCAVFTISYRIALVLALCLLHISGFLPR